MIITAKEKIEACACDVTAYITIVLEDEELSEEIKLGLVRDASFTKATWDQFVEEITTARTSMRAALLRIDPQEG